MAKAVLDKNCVTHCTVRLEKDGVIRGLISGDVNSFFPSNLSQGDAVELKVKDRPEGNYKITKIYVADGRFDLNLEGNADLVVPLQNDPPAKRLIRSTAPAVVREVTADIIKVHDVHSYENSFLGTLVYVFICPECSTRCTTFKPADLYTCECGLDLELIIK